MAPGEGLPVVIVGPCAVGKSTLQQELTHRGVPARCVAQEHSTVPTLFRRRPQAGLVFLTATWATVHARRPLSTGRAQYLHELVILRTARAEAGLVVHTDSRTPPEVADVVEEWWRRGRGGVPDRAV
jgi:GTPase SAR1 family protein